MLNRKGKAWHEERHGTRHEDPVLRAVSCASRN